VANVILYDANNWAGCSKKWGKFVARTVRFEGRSTDVDTFPWKA
jgi:hypothetical protein